MLSALGLDEVQESAYRTLVVLGAAEVPDIADRLTLPQAEALRVLHRLERQGLAARSSARPGRWVAAPPAAALGALLARQRRELEQAERAAVRLAEEYRTGGTEPDVHDLVEVVTGASAVAHRFLQLRLSAAEEVCTLVTGPADALAGLPGGDREPGERVVSRGARHRVVIERAVLARPSGVMGLSAALGRDEQVRVVDAVPTQLVVADRGLAMIPLTGRSSEPAALVVHASGLLESLVGLFEGIWRSALPLRLGSDGLPRPAEPDGPDDTDLEILSLLLAGLTDASVAKQLDLGLRTVQRRVKRLMELTGVTTRLQLGWHTYELGWVSREAGHGGGRPVPCPPGPGAAPSPPPGSAPFVPAPAQPS